MLRLTSKKLNLIPLIQTFFKVRRLEFQIKHGMYESCYLVDLVFFAAED